MSKSVLVIDTPKDCDKCKFCDYGDYTCGAFGIIGKKFTYETPEEGVADWCPLKPLPEKMQVCGKYPQPDGIVPSYKIGWNACIDEITGGNNND